MLSIMKTLCCGLLCLLSVKSLLPLLSVTAMFLSTYADASKASQDSKERSPEENNRCGNSAGIGTSDVLRNTEDRILRSLEMPTSGPSPAPNQIPFQSSSSPRWEVVYRGISGEAAILDLGEHETDTLFWGSMIFKR